MSSSQCPLVVIAAGPRRKGSKGREREVYESVSKRGGGRAGVKILGSSPCRSAAPDGEHRRCRVVNSAWGIRMMTIGCETTSAGGNHWYLRELKARNPGVEREDERE